MNDETKQFVENSEFETLFKELSEKHKPIKAKVSGKKLEALGLVIIKFQRLESTIRMFIRTLANTGDQQLMMILTAKNSFKHLLLVLSAVASYKEFHRKDDLDFLINQCYKAEEIRNQLIHSVWTAGPRLKANLKKKQGLQHKSETYSEEELNKIADKIDKIDTVMSAIEYHFIEDCLKKGINLKGVKVIKL